MKRIAGWAFCAVGALAIGYLALYAYAVFHRARPGSPAIPFISSASQPDAPSYS